MARSIRVPDFTKQSTRQWWGTLYTSFVSDGLAGFWNDMNEPSVFNTPGKTIPDDVQHRIDEVGFQPRVASHREVHNVYGMQNSRPPLKGYSRFLPTGARLFSPARPTRGATLRCYLDRRQQRHLESFAVDDSHAREPWPQWSGNEWRRRGRFYRDAFSRAPHKWTELATFQPIDRNHSEKGTALREPWVHGPEQESIRRRYIEERYKLMPYLYTAVEEMSRTGLPVLRPLFVEFPEATADKHPLDLDAGNEFLFGSALLVAHHPFRTSWIRTASNFHRWIGTIIGPGSVWKRRSQKTVIRIPRAPAPNPVLVHPALDTLPVYVREGSILPMQPLTQSTNETPKGPLLLRVYPGAIARVRFIRTTETRWHTSAVNFCEWGSGAKFLETRSGCTLAGTRARTVPGGGNCEWRFTDGTPTRPIEYRLARETPDRQSSILLITWSVSWFPTTVAEPIWKSASSTSRTLYALNDDKGPPTSPSPSSGRVVPVPGCTVFVVLLHAHFSLGSPQGSGLHSAELPDLAEIPH